MGKIQVNQNLEIDECEITFNFVHASGPGGQNVNKVATAAQLRFNTKTNSSIDEQFFIRLKKIGGKKITSSGTIIIEAKRFRSQEKNREDALARLIVLLDKASQIPIKRKKTNPTSSSKEKRILNKKRQSEKKENRRLKF